MNQQQRPFVERFSGTSVQVRWEYKIINDWEWEHGNLNSEFELNELGKQGWELVCVVSMLLYSPGAMPEQIGTGKSWYFKRQLL